MGLDMYAFAFKSDTTEQVDLARPDRSEGTEEVHYWRKHHDLHGWMESLYYAKGGTSQCFNCNTVRLTAEDLDRLEEDLGTDALPPTTGFFFGNNPPDAESRADDLEFIAKARAALAEGKVVVYDSWW